MGQLIPFLARDLSKKGVYENSLFLALENVSMKSCNFQVKFLLFSLVSM